MADEKQPRYTALVERSGQSWAIRVAELPGVFSRARRLDGVESMARDAISLLLDVPADSFAIDVREVIDPGAGVLVAAAIQARADAEETQRLATTIAREAVRTLDRMGLAQRDIGRLMHLSHQRVAQLLASSGDG